MKYDNVIQHMESDIYFLTYMSQSNGVTHFSARLCHDNKVHCKVYKTHGAMHGSAVTE